MAHVYKKLGKIDDSYEYYKICLSVVRSVFGERLLEVAKVFNHLGSICYELGKLKDSLKCFEKSLDIKQ